VAYGGDTHNDGSGVGQADTFGDAQAARGVPYHATGRRSDRTKIDAQERLYDVAVIPVTEPEQAIVAAHVVPARRLPCAYRYLEE